MEKINEINWNEYKNSLICEAKTWDYIIITASNNMQAIEYEKEIEFRKNKKLLPLKTKYIVITDPNEKRIGSGGATLNILKVLKEMDCNIDFGKEKILLIHSGGDCKRIPQYSVIGKLFMWLQRKLPDGRTATLFDELIISFTKMSQKINSGMVILSGDVLLLFDYDEICLKEHDIVALSNKIDINIGVNHGVFLTDSKNNLLKFLHKKSKKELIKNNAVDKNDLVDIDTGFMYLSEKIIKSMLELICTKGKIDIQKFDEYANEKLQISLYNDIMYVFSKNATEEEYLNQKTEGVYCEDLIKIRKNIWKKLSKYNAIVLKPKKSKFIHLGTTNELLNFLNSNKNSYYSMMSYIDETSSVESNSYIENCSIRNSKIGKNVVLVNSNLNKNVVPSNVCISTIKTKNGKYVSRIYGIHDNPKCIFDKDVVFLNTSLKNAFEKYNLKSKDIFKNEKVCNIWNADLYTICNSNEQSIKSALKLYEIVHCKASKEDVIQYLNSKRTSINKSNKMCDIKYLKKNMLLRDSQLERCDIKFEYNYNFITKDTYNASNEVEIKLPIRINFGGGWTDTPPYCIQEGGSVINASFLLNGEMPIKCKIKKIQQHVIILKSIDYNEQEEINEIEQISNIQSSKNNLGLLKSALMVSGIVKKEDKNVEDVLKRIGGGIIIQTDATKVPKESGLGTSSILAGACLIAIYTFFDIPFTKEDVCQQVLKVEQLMGTYGGWQDQIGGIFEGIKYTKSKQGNIQKFTIENININQKLKDTFEKRLILVYIGVSKRAEKLLKIIMNKYVLEDSEVCDTLKQIKTMANKMKESLKKQDFKMFCKLLNEHWELSKKLDIGCTNDKIEQILSVLNDLIEAKMICGAGGRGFLQIILKEGKTKEEVMNRLKNNFDDKNIELYDVSLI